MRWTLSKLREELETGGPEAIAALLAGRPAFLIRRPRGEDGELLADTPLQGTAAGAGTTPITHAWNFEKTHDDDAQLPWVMADGESVVVLLAKSDRNPFVGVITVGRNATNDLLLNSSRVSKLHAFLKDGRAGWEVEDNGSRNGTFVDSLRLTAKVPARLVPGAELRFADVAGMFLDAESLVALIRVVGGAP